MADRVSFRRASRRLEGIATRVPFVSSTTFPGETREFVARSVGRTRQRWWHAGNDSGRRRSRDRRPSAQSPWL
jgi:hypothetical protein